MTRRTPKQLSEARRVGLATILVGASALILLTIAYSTKSKASEIPRAEGAIIFTCAPLPPPSKDYLCTVRLASKQYLDNTTAPLPKPQIPSPVTKGKASI